MNCAHYLCSIGKYPSKPTLPAVPGNECVAEVIACGPKVQSFNVGDRFIPLESQLGTWRTHALFEESDIFKVPSNVGIVEAATLTVNPPSGYLMLRDYVTVSKGDTVIQNGANSAVGQVVFQLCKLWGINCVGVVRDRPDLKELVTFLKDMGATEVLTEEQIRTTTLFKSNQLARPKLALNCVGGKSSTELLRHLSDKGVMVTYGAMSREPVTAPNAALIFKDISFRGFWMHRWKFDHSRNERIELYHKMIEFILAGHLKAPAHKLISFNDHEKALTESLDFKGFAGAKYVFDFSN